MQARKYKKHIGKRCRILRRSWPSSVLGDATSRARAARRFGIPPGIADLRNPTIRERSPHMSRHSIVHKIVPLTFLCGVLVFIFGLVAVGGPVNRRPPD